MILFDSFGEQKDSGTEFSSQFSVLSSQFSVLRKAKRACAALSTSKASLAA